MLVKKNEKKTVAEPTDLRPDNADGIVRLIVTGDARVLLVSLVPSKARLTLVLDIVCWYLLASVKHPCSTRVPGIGDQELLKLHR